MNRLPNQKESNIATTIFFVKAALKHPMRVAKPAQAKLFVVPTLNNVVFEAWYREQKVCVKGCCDGHDILRRAANFLEKPIRPKNIQIRTMVANAKPVFFS